jgi:dipeptidyl aminopeptidase/acylaminoacyl peptidase
MKSITHFLSALVFLGATTIAAAADERVLPAPNYELASRWMPSKVGKLVFDMNVTPRWAETSDRFFYTFETAQGRTFQLVDPVKRTRVPLWDNAKMAAMLTNLTRIPFDAQHLPMGASRPAAPGGGGGEPTPPPMLKWAKNDTVIQFEIEVPKEAKIPGEKPPVKPEPKKAVADEAAGKGDKKETASAEKDPEEAKTTKTLYFEYEIATGKLSILHEFTPDPKKPGWAQISPDDKTIIFARGHNLFMMDAENYKLALKDFGDTKVQETQITTDGVEHYSFARRINEQARTTLKKDQKGDTKHKDGPRVPAIVLQWAKDSSKYSGVRQDLRKVGDLWVINSLASPRPKLETYRYAMPGEENVDQAELLVFDRETKARITVKADAFKDQTIQVATSRVTARQREKQKTEGQWLSETNDKLYFQRNSRDLHRVDLCVADTKTGEVKTIIEERLNTYIENQPLWTLGDGKEFIHWSERDGWGHYYLFGADGTLKNQITTGEFVTGPITWVDEKLRVMYFTANGREAAEDPYFTHLYRVNLDGTGLKLLAPGNASHTAVMSDSGKYFINTQSQVDTAPRSELFDYAGMKITDLETTDVSALVDAGFKFPEPFKVKADDGVTDLYGVMYKPFDFDPAKRYPIIAYVYPGPQTESVTKTFSPRNANVALANLGFIVIEVGNRGGHPQRSKWYHNYGYGNLRDYGLADKKAAIEHLARKNSWIDMNLVGIYGHSGGGFMSTAAMLVYPDFFKAAVSSSGNHENNVYNRAWSEKHHGVKEVADKDGKVKFEYSIDRNSELAKNLKGHLFLVTGDQDDNVHPAGTLRMADALIKANKRFDFFIMTGQRHGYGPMTDYFFWLRADYFSKHLLGRSSESVDLIELAREAPQNGKRRPGAGGTPEEDR